MFIIDEEVWYERVTAIRLTQKDEVGRLVDRYFPQVEMTIVDDEGESTDWVVLQDEGGNTVFCDSELEALQRAIAYRNKLNSY